MVKNSRTIKMESVSLCGGLLALMAYKTESRTRKKMVRAWLTFEPVTHSSPSILIFGGKSDLKKASEILVKVRKFVAGEHKRPTPDGKVKSRLLHAQLCAYSQEHPAVLADIEAILFGEWQEVKI